MASVASSVRGNGSDHLGTLLTLALGFEIEHPGHDDPFFGGMLVATAVAFIAAFGSDLRLHHLEAREASESRRAEAEHRRELFSAIEQSQRLASARCTRGQHARLSAALLWAVLLAYLLRSMRRTTRTSA